MRLLHQLKFIVIVYLLVLSQGGIANEVAFCSDYARSSVLAHIQNIKSECGFATTLWNPGLRQHQKWCLRGNTNKAQQRQAARAELLEQCGRAMQRSLSWQELDFSVQNKLFGELIVAVSMDDVDSLKLFEAQGVDLNFEWHLIEGGILYWAIANQASQVTHYLIEQKSANPNATRNGGPNPLVTLLNHPSNVNYRLLDYLLRKGARPNHGGEDYSDDSFPLTTAAVNNDLESVRLLLKYNADPNLYESVPALMVAVYNNNSRMVDLLLNAGANPNRGLNGLDCSSIRSSQTRGNLLAMDSAMISGNIRITNSLSKSGAKTTLQCLSN